MMPWYGYVISIGLAWLLGIMTFNSITIWKMRSDNRELVDKMKDDLDDIQKGSD